MKTKFIHLISLISLLFLSKGFVYGQATSATGTNLGGPADFIGWALTHKIND